MAKHGAAMSPSAEDVAINNFLIEQVKLAFMAIPAVQARRYLLCKGLGLTYAEVTQIEGCSRNAAKESLIRAKKNLSEILSLPIYPSEHGVSRETFFSLRTLTTE